MELGLSGSVHDSFTESVVEQAGLGSPASLGYSVKYGPEISSGELLTKQLVGKGN